MLSVTLFRVWTKFCTTNDAMARMMRRCCVCAGPMGIYGPEDIITHYGILHCVRPARQGMPSSSPLRNIFNIKFYRDPWPIKTYYSAFIVYWSRCKLVITCASGVASEFGAVCTSKWLWRWRCYCCWQVTMQKNVDQYNGLLWICLSNREKHCDLFELFTTYRCGGMICFVTENIYLNKQR